MNFFPLAIVVNRVNFTHEVLHAHKISRPIYKRCIMQVKRPLPISRSDIRNYFEPRTYERGEAYFLDNHVEADRIEFKMPYLHGYVQGSKRKPYRPDITFKKRKGVWTIDIAYCSCPVFFNCKHSVALLLTTGQIYGFEGDTEATTYSLYKEDKLITAKTAKWLHSLEIALQDKERSQNEIEVSDVIYGLQSLDVSWKNDWLTPSIYFCSRGRNGTRLKRATAIDILKFNVGRVSSKDCEVAALYDSIDKLSQHQSLDDVGTLVELCLSKMIETGRCYFHSILQPTLSLGPQLNAELTWTLLSNGKQIPQLKVASAGEIKTFLRPIPWYIDLNNATSGPLVIPFAKSALEVFMSAPELEDKEAKAVRLVLEKVTSGEKLALPVDTGERYVIDKDPIRKLILQSKNVTYHDDELLRLGFALGSKAPFVALTFDYGVGGIDFTSNKKEITFVENDSITTVVRNLDLEKDSIQVLQKTGLEMASNLIKAIDRIPFCPKREAYEKTASASNWFKFLQVDLPLLQQQGWQVEIDPSFTIQFVEAGEEWSSTVEKESDWWFSLDIGIDVNGTKVSLLPILVEALKKAPYIYGPEDLDHLNIDGKFYAPLNDGSIVILPFERVRDLLRVILDIFDRNADANNIRINPWQAAELQGKCITLEAESRLARLAERVKQFKEITAIDAPPNFHATLREYQKEGLGWLNFLREFEAGGVLADDMGLGKTVQTLCHLLIEKNEGRLNYPALIVCPTSVLPNWLAEAKKFTPDLRILALHGAERLTNFKEIYEHDVVVTTYPLLHRDKHQLCKREWHVVVLDEAQFIRNPETLAAQAAFQLKSNYRICLTGTPVENHLGDLWSQFHFLIPGYLSDQKTFHTYFRQPIEKYGDTYRQKLLSVKVRPFMLRRTKREVAAELPAKTIMIENVQLDGAQRDLYETVRLTMHEKIKDEIEQKGFKRSQIVILEALLRLRQACCDPRLLGTVFQHKATDSAKLHHLMEMISQLVEEKRKMLIFSQFTSMLDLIADELNKRKIEFVEIRGDTKDRAEPVRKFQNEDVPVFLLSLKAGGTGLNLTAADTVIHYDPWWNPAVENQATDRAHRIGQTKPVFVYKMIATGTLEEKMLQLQEKKKALADAVFDPEKAGSIKITEEELDFLFRPIGDEPKVEEMTGKYKNRIKTSDPGADSLLDITMLDEAECKPMSTNIDKPPARHKPASKDKPHTADSEGTQKAANKPVARPEGSTKEIKSRDAVDPFIAALLKQGLSPEEIAKGLFSRKKNH